MALVLALWIGLQPRTAQAEDPVFTGYERSVIEQQLRRTGGRVDPSPEGKIISAIEVVRLEVFDESDPVPDFLNIFHTTTLQKVIESELLFRTGTPFSALSVDQTARNLRRLRQVSLVLIVPITDDESGRVRVLVITKDVWSLRMNFDLEVTRSGLNSLLLNPSEENLFGTHASVGGLFVLLPNTYSLGMLLSHTRIAGTQLSGITSYNRVFSRHSGSSEGSFGSFVFWLPQYSAEQKWAYATGVVWSDTIQRVNLPVEPRRLLAYDRERYVGRTEVTRSFGRVHKLDLTLGMEADRRAYRPLIPAGTPAEDQALFLERYVPVSDTRISPFVQLESYENVFLKTIELETLGLQEDYRLGPQALLRLYPASRSLGSSRDLLGMVAGVSYGVALGDGLLRALATSTIEYAGQKRHDNLTTLSLRVASPRLGVGRLVFDGFFADRQHNYLNRRFALGGDNRLRGYPPSSLELLGGEDQRGADALVFNTEFRSTSVNVLSAQCGLAAFYDVGDATDRWDALAFKHGLGLGLRILFPQLNRIVLRADWAVPLNAGYRPLPGEFFVTFGQAFVLPGLGSERLDALLL